MTDLRKQAQNANRHTERGTTALAESVTTDGWIGAITVAADMETFDGSARLDVLDGLDVEPLIVHSDGKRPLVLVRDDLPTAADPRAVRLGLAANRVASLNLAWDVDLVAEMRATIDLSYLWDDDEQESLVGASAGVPETAGAPDDDDDDPSVAPGAAEASDGSLLALTEVTIAEPRHVVAAGDIWYLGVHVLVCANVFTDWPTWARFLTPDSLFVPYPGPFITLTLKAQAGRLVLVQPSRYVAGHLLDQHENVYGEGSVHRG